MNGNQSPYLGNDMTADEITRVVAEIERRWRERTPAKDITEVLASWKISRGEIRLWCNQQGIALDECDDAFNAEVLRMYNRLRREFPDERWDVHTAGTKELAKRMGIRLVRNKGKQ